MICINFIIKRKKIQFEKGKMLTILTNTKRRVTCLPWISFVDLFVSKTRCVSFYLCFTYPLSFVHIRIGLWYIYFSVCSLCHQFTKHLYVSCHIICEDGQKSCHLKHMVLWFIRRNNIPEWFDNEHKRKTVEHEYFDADRSNRYNHNDNNHFNVFK